MNEITTVDADLATEVIALCGIDPNKSLAGSDAQTSPA